MPIKPFALEDLTATLQVPIPGVPGAYGEIELSGEGTATIALGAEVPVPLLDDYINGEIQVEIDKEGEIAYGIELNLVGLSIEAMVRGCDIVVDLGYGLLATQATFPIPDCEKPEPPEPIPLPDPGGDDDWGGEEESYPLPPPDYPDDTPIMALVYVSSTREDFLSTHTVHWTVPDGENSTYSKSERITSSSTSTLVNWIPENGTEMMSESASSQRIYSNSDGENINRTNSSDWLSGWQDGRSLRPYSNVHYTIPGDSGAWHDAFVAPFYYGYREGGAGGSFGVTIPRQSPGASSQASWVYVGTAGGLKRAMADYPEYYCSRTKVSRTGYTRHNEVYWSNSKVIQTGSGVSYYQVWLDGIVVHPYKPISWGDAQYKLLNMSDSYSRTVIRQSYTRDMIVRKLNTNKTPPLQGEPPMKDCCDSIRAELRRLRKEVKEIRVDFVEPIHEVVNPEMFTEKILPPKFDDEGQLIKPGNGAVTLPDVLQEIGQQSGDNSFDSDIARVEDENIPISWEENKIKQELPGEKVGTDWIYRELFTLLHEIRYAIDPTDIKDSSIPSRFIYPGIKGGYEKVRNYPELFKYLFLMLDKVGFQPFQVIVEDSNPALAGKQTERQEYHSMGAALESITKYLIDIEGDQDAHTSFLVRLAYEVIIMHQINADTQQTVQNIQDFLGYEVKKKKESIPMAFNPLADNPSARKDVDENTEESIEKLLPNLLKNGNAQVTLDEYVGRKDLVDFLFEILNAARQKPKGNRLA